METSGNSEDNMISDARLPPSGLDHWDT